MKVIKTRELESGKVALAHYKEGELINSVVEPWETTTERFSIYITAREDALPDKGPQIFFKDISMADHYFQGVT